MNRVADLLGEQYRSPAAQTGSVSRGLPPAAYTSDEFFQIECERLFARTWTFAGFAQDLTHSGDIWPTHIAGQPIALVKGSDGHIRAFHNVCRHRGHLLVDEPCTASRNIVCPYHAWTYGLDGALLRTPNFGGASQPHVEGFDTAANGLIEVRCDVWRDWVFVNLDGAAPPLSEHVSDVERRLAGVDWDSMKPVARFATGDVRCNWKFLVENFIEPYHVPVVHPKTAAGQPLKAHEMFVDDNCYGCTITVDEAQADAGLSDHLDMTSHYLAAFPNFILGRYFPDQIGVHLNMPVAPNLTRQWRAIYFTGDQVPDAAEVQALVELWQSVHKEDHSVTERLQAGRASSATMDGGVLSPHWETSIAHFHDLVIRAVE